MDNRGDQLRPRMIFDEKVTGKTVTEYDLGSNNRERDVFCLVRNAEVLFCVTDFREDF
jgi:hypothetical protein